jgi:hypothetical protein
MRLETAFFSFLVGIAIAIANEDALFRPAERKGKLRAVSAAAGGRGARKLQASCDSYLPINPGITTINIQWLGRGGAADTEWLNVANWATDYLPGTNRFNRLIMAVNDHGTVNCPATYMAHDVKLEMKSGATLDVQADLTIGDELYMMTNSKLTQSGQSVVTVGARLYLAAMYEISVQAQLEVGENIYCPITGHLTIKDNSSVSAATVSAEVDSEMHGRLTYVLGPSGAGLFTVNGHLLISNWARLVVDASAYSSGATTIPLIKYTSKTGSFDPTDVDVAPVVTGLVAGLTSQIKTLNDGVYLELSQDGVSPLPVPDPTPSPTKAPTPVAANPVPSLPPTPSPTKAPTPVPATPVPSLPPTPNPTLPTPTTTDPTPSPMADASIPAPIDLVDTIPDSEGYELVYELDPIPVQPNFAGDVGYTREDLDHPPFSRVAYFIELDGTEFGHQWAWVSMDNFTDNVAFTGVPCPVCGQGALQQSVTDAHVVSNVPGLDGTSLAGNIEFWPFNYAPDNSVGVPYAFDDVYDCGVSSGNREEASLWVMFLPHNDPSFLFVSLFSRWLFFLRIVFRLFVLAIHYIFRTHQSPIHQA